MSNSIDQKQNLINYLIENYTPGQKWADIADKFGYKPERARKIWLNYRNNNHIQPREVGKSGPKVTQMQEDIKFGQAEVTINSDEEIRNLDDLKKLIDTDKWDVAKYVQNYWNGKYQVKAWLEPKESKESDVIKNILANYKTTWKPISKNQIVKNSVWNTDSLLVINLNDLHFDKLDLTNNTIDQRIDDYQEVLENLVMRAYHSANIEEILFVVGNDMFNTDNIHGTTTNGTPQVVNTTWDVAYEKVFNCMVNSIAYLKNFCNNIVVKLVQGNHDRTKSYYLAHALEVYFGNDVTIKFDRTSQLKKVHVYGNTFLGFNHGNNINDKLPLAFATQFATEWGQCKYHDLLISDKHHNNEKIFKSNQTQNEFQGVKLRILPSLSGTDKWHDDNLYHSRQSGIALLYDKVKGKNMEIEYQL